MDQAKQKRMETANSIIISISKYVIYFLAIAVAIGELGLTSAMNSMLAAAGVGGLVLSIGSSRAWLRIWRRAFSCCLKTRWRSGIM